MVKVNAVVRYAEPEQGEQGLLFVVREVNGDRCMVALLNEQFPIAPVTVGLTADFSVVVDSLEARS